MDDRKSYIGGSDAPAVLGLSRWKTPLEIWSEKCGFIESEDISDQMAVRVGKKLENTVAEFFMEETGKKLRRVNEHRTHKQYPFICAQIDRIVEGEDAIVELKTASGWKAKEWSGEDIPREYEIQVHHQLAVTGKPLGYIAVLIGNQDFKIKEIKRDEKIIASLIEKEIAFWNNYVIPKMMPETITADDNEILYQLYPEVTVGEDISLPDEANILIEQLQAYSQDKIELEKSIDENKNRLKALLKNSELGHTKIWRVSWKKQKGSTYQVTRPETRVLKYNLITKQEG